MAILGIDEVGRGPWAGPLVIGAVILPDQKPDWVDELNDSKKLSVKKREKLNELILKEAAATGFGWVSSAEIDELGLAASLKLAARRAVEEIQKQHVPFTEIIIDGTINFLAGTKLENYVTILPKADFLIKEVSAASIIAKVARDHYMYELAEKYPAYGFEKHVGYGTAAHQKALKEHGVCPEHRRSFSPIQKIVGESSAAPKTAQTTKQIGDRAEEKVREYLKNHGHEILEHNAKSKYYEIDIISTKDGSLYFTEVKYRKNTTRGGGLAAVDSKKQKRMKFAAECYLKAHPKYQAKNPTLAVANVSGREFKIDDWFPLAD